MYVDLRTSMSACSLEFCSSLLKFFWFRECSWKLLIYKFKIWVVRYQWSLCWLCRGTGLVHSSNTLLFLLYNPTKRGFTWVHDDSTWMWDEVPMQPTWKQRLMMYPELVSLKWLSSPTFIDCCLFLINHWPIDRVQYVYVLGTINFIM